MTTEATGARVGADRVARADRRPAPIVDHERSSVPGVPVLVLGLALAVATVAAGVYWVGSLTDRSVSSVPDFAIAVALAAATVASLSGLTAVGPNEAVTTTLFGTYAGTLRRQGLHWINPLASATDVSLALAVIEASEIKVNDLNGNPIEVGTVVTWSVVDPAQAVFGVDDHVAFVGRQSETATRTVVARHPYEVYPAIVGADGVPLEVPASLAALAPAEGGPVALLGHDDAVSEELAEILGAACARVGVAIHSVAISRLSYASEIAPEMLQRQKAMARLSAQSAILQSATGLVRHAMRELRRDEGGKEGEAIEPHQAYAIAGNLLVTLVSGQGAAPVIGVGST